MLIYAPDLGFLGPLTMLQIPDNSSAVTRIDGFVWAVSSILAAGEGNDYGRSCESEKEVIYHGQDVDGKSKFGGAAKVPVVDFI